MATSFSLTLTGALLSNLTHESSPQPLTGVNPSPSPKLRLNTSPHPHPQALTDAGEKLVVVDFTATCRRTLENLVLVAPQLTSPGFVCLALHACGCAPHSAQAAGTIITHREAAVQRGCCSRSYCWCGVCPAPHGHAARGAARARLVADEHRQVGAQWSPSIGSPVTHTHVCGYVYIYIYVHV